MYMVSIPKGVRKKEKKGWGNEAPGKVLPFRVGQPCAQMQLCN